MAFDLGILSTRVLTSDGAWGTELDKLGCPPGFCRERWNLDRPDAVRQVAAAYVAAGSQIILTNTFSGNRIALDKHGLGDQVAAINRAGAEISKDAAGDAAAVFASMGSTGKMVMMDEITSQALTELFAEQAEALAAGGADAIVIETMTELAEAVAALHGAKRATDLPVVVSMTFDSGPDRLATVMGTTADLAARELTAGGADAVGCNCGMGIEHYVKVVEALAAATDVPIWAKPNAGLPELIDGRVVYKETPEEFAAHVPALVAAGARVVGGCCGTTPDHVRAIRSAIAGIKT